MGGKTYLKQEKTFLVLPALLLVVTVQQLEPVVGCLLT
jgi:hypothetical protein